MQPRDSVFLGEAEREMIEFIRDGLSLSLPLATDAFVVRSALSWLVREIRAKLPPGTPT